ncbi:hypothetical protein AWB75_02767 [Caballeronia catudaia]|uniref:Transmembrane protein n=1 Tax=Caballeronia catudaia TaxID=1777136 RepID=A0A158AYU3_9BURK|nr:hypothetical protein [Caballeronia catudaia]SAK62955.1 hypothetical protein AWB75_02767 [Caballeronia catudaia]
MKPLLRVVLVVNALIFVAFGVLFLLTPWPGLYGALQLDSIRVQPAFAGQLLGIALAGLAWLAFHAAVDGALTARAARVSGHVEWLSGVVVLVWLLGLKTPAVDGFGQMSAAVVGIVLLVLGLGSVRLSSAVRRRERAAQAGAASAQRAEKKAAQKREDARATAASPLARSQPVDTVSRPAARAPAATAIDPVSGRAIDSNGRPLDPASPISPAAVRAHPDGAVDPVTGGTLDPATGRAIDPITGRRIEPVISGEIDPATGRRADPLAPDTGRAPR